MTKKVMVGLEACEEEKTWVGEAEEEERDWLIAKGKAG